MKPQIAQFSAPGVDWNDLKIVLAVARANSIKRACQKLQMTESTVSRHVSSLEEYLGAVLFERTPAGMIATHECRSLLEHLSRAETEVEAGVEAAATTNNAMAGSVRVTSVPMIVNHLLVPNVPRFMRQYSAIELEFVGIPADLSMARREADLAVRLSRPTADLGAVTRRLGSLNYGVFALKGRGREAPWLTYEKDMSELPQARWISARVQKGNEQVCPLRSNDAECLFASVRVGLGKTLLPKEVASSLPDLVELSGYEDLPVREVWLLAHPNLIVTPRVRAVCEWLQSLFTGFQAPGATD